MTVQEAIAARMQSIEAEHLDGTPTTPTPAPMTVAEAVARRLQAIAEAFTPPAPPPVTLAAHTMPARLQMTGGAVTFE